MDDKPLSKISTFYTGKLSPLSGVKRSEVREHKPKYMVDKLPELPQCPDGFMRYSLDRTIYERKNAVLVVLGGKEYWFPLSKVRIGLSQGKQVIDIPEWLLVKKDLIRIYPSS